jgi:hypothetical protein
MIDSIDSAMLDTRYSMLDPRCLLLVARRSSLEL